MVTRYTKGEVSQREITEKMEKAKRARPEKTAKAKEKQKYVFSSQSQKKVARTDDSAQGITGC